MYDYSRLATRAKEIIERFGRDVTISRQSTALKDPAKPWLGKQESKTSFTVKSVIYPIKKRFDDQDSVITTEKEALIAASATGLTIEPQTGDTIIDSSINYRVVSSEKVKTGDTSLIYQLVINQ